MRPKGLHTAETLVPALRPLGYALARLLRGSDCIYDYNNINTTLVASWHKFEDTLESEINANSESYLLLLILLERIELESTQLIEYFNRVQSVHAIFSKNLSLFKAIIAHIHSQNAEYSPTISYDTQPSSSYVAPSEVLALSELYAATQEAIDDRRVSIKIPHLLGEENTSDPAPLKPTEGGVFNSAFLDALEFRPRKEHPQVLPSLDNVVAIQASPSGYFVIHGSPRDLNDSGSASLQYGPTKPKLN